MKGRMISAAILLVLALSGTGQVRGDELITVTAAVDKQTAYIGDLIDYTITVTYDSTLRLTPPATGANLGGFDVKEYEVGEERSVEGGKRQQALRFEMRTFTTGDYVIPPLAIEYMLPDSTKKYISADPIKISIKSLMAEGVSADTLQLRPAKPQVSLSQRRTGLWLAIAGAVIGICAAAVYVMRRRRRAKVEAEFVDLRPAWEIATAELALLKEKDLVAKGEVRLFYFELSEIFRNYLGKKFEFDAIDLTTSEIYEALEQATLDNGFHKEAMAFLEHADLVKFAKYIPAPERLGEDWERACDMVSRSKHMVVNHPVPPEPEPVERVEAVSAEGEYSELKYAPPELRELLASDQEEEKP